MSQRLSVRPVLVRNAVVAVVYAALGALALSIASVGVSVPFWPGAGVAFACVYRWRAPILPGVFAGSLIAEVVSLNLAGVGSWLPSPAAAAIAAGAAGQALVGGWLVRRFIDDRSLLDSVPDIPVFLLLSGPVAAVVSATVGTATQAATGILTAGQGLDAWLVWWVGDAIGIIVFGPLTLMLLPDPRRVWAGRRWAIALPSLGACAVLVTIVVVNGSNERSQVATARGRTAEQAAATLHEVVELHQQALESVKDQQLASDEVTAAQFRFVATPLLAGNPTILALSWNPVVPQRERAAFEAAQRAQPGRSSYTITQRDTHGHLVPAGPRPGYVPVQHIEPAADNRAAIGFDIASDPDRLDAVRTATDTGLPTATAPIELVQGNGAQTGFLVLNPTYRGGVAPPSVDARRDAIAGFATGVYRVDALLDLVYADPAWDDISVRLIDVTDTDRPTMIAERAASSQPAAAATDGGPTWVDAQPIDVFGRRWMLELTPVTGPLLGGGGRLATFVLLIALVGVYLFETIVLLLTGLERRASRDATQRTYEATHDALTGVVNRRGFIDSLQSLAASAETDRATHMLLFADLDRFKQVNDRAGHAAGDAMLVAVAEALADRVRAGDTVARIGGDEFAVILRDCTIEAGERMARTITDAIDAISLPTDAGVMRVGVSVGLTPFGHGYPTDPSEALRRADAAAYRAKGMDGSAIHHHRDGVD